MCSLMCALFQLPEFENLATTMPAGGFIVSVPEVDMKTPHRRIDYGNLGLFAHSTRAYWVDNPKITARLNNGKVAGRITLRLR